MGGVSRAGYRKRKESEIRFVMVQGDEAAEEPDGEKGEE